MTSEIPTAPNGYVALTDMFDIAIRTILEPYADASFETLIWLRNRKLFRFVSSVSTEDTTYNGIFVHLADELRRMAETEQVDILFFDKRLRGPRKVVGNELSTAIQGHGEPVPDQGINTNFVMRPWQGGPLVLPRDKSFLRCADALIETVSGIRPPDRRRRWPVTLSGLEWERMAGEMRFWPLDFCLMVIDADRDIDKAASKYSAWLDYGGEKFVRTVGDRSFSGYFPFTERHARSGELAVFGVRAVNSRPAEQPRMIHPIEWMDLSIHFVRGLGYVARRDGSGSTEPFWHSLHVDRESLLLLFDSIGDSDKPIGRPPTARLMAEAAAKALYPPDGTRPKGVKQSQAIFDINNWLKNRGERQVSETTILRALGER